MVEKRITDGRYEDDSTKESVVLITSKYQATLYESKIMFFSLARVKLDENGRYVARFTAAELRKLLDVSDKSHSFYDSLTTNADKMVNFIIYMQDAEKEEFDFVNLITRATYKNGIFEVVFNNELKELYDNRFLKKKYAVLSKSEVKSFRSETTFRLYEILKSEMHVNKNTIVLANEEQLKLTGFSEFLNGDEKEEQEQIPDDMIYHITYNVNELKFMLGCINTKIPEVAKIFKEAYKKGGPVDYDEIMAKVQALAKKETNDYLKREQLTPTWKRWVNFRIALEQAIEELNEKTSLRVKMDTETYGRGGRVKNVCFTVYDEKKVKEHNENLKNADDGNEEEEVSGLLLLQSDPEQYDNFIAEIVMSLEGKFSFSQCKMFVGDVFKSVSFDERELNDPQNAKKYITDTYEYCKKQGGIVDIVPYFRSALQKDYCSSTGEGTSRINSKKPVNVDNYMQGEYDDSDFDFFASQEEN